MDVDDANKTILTYKALNNLAPFIYVNYRFGIIHQDS